MNYDPNIKAHLVWDGLNLHVPSEMGSPSPAQLQGTGHERLSELCCRICYDSLGRGRGSKEMHEHLLDVKHWSVYEHGHFTVCVTTGSESDHVCALAALLNRPGLSVSGAENYEFRVTLNYRHLLDWGRWSRRGSGNYNSMDKIMDEVLFGSFLFVAQGLAPAIMQRLSHEKNFLRADSLARLVDPVRDYEKWITLYLSGSRGMSHEQVRHRFCISQRSTRYCNEAESPWIEHPLISKYLDDESVPVEERNSMRELRKDTADECRSLYGHVVSALETYLVRLGVEKLTARKQARGAARGDLGNALQTEMMFSASVADWKDMLGLRYNAAADAEIRCMYGPVLAALKESQYADEFSSFEAVPAPDGIGTVLKA